MIWTLGEMHGGDAHDNGRIKAGVSSWTHRSGGTGNLLAVSRRDKRFLRKQEGLES
jgi:hypothetical protein